MHGLGYDFARGAGGVGGKVKEEYGMVGPDRDLFEITSTLFL